jgi:hypothetical protein
VKRVLRHAGEAWVRDGRRVAAARYRIVVGGHLSSRHHVEFDELEIEAGDDETVLTGRIVDQAQLQGLLDRIAALDLVLVSVNRLDEPSGGGAASGMHPAAAQELTVHPGEHA